MKHTMHTSRMVLKYYTVLYRYCENTTYIPQGAVKIRCRIHSTSAVNTLPRG